MLAESSVVASRASDPREKSKKYLVGGIASINRKADPDILFQSAEGAHLTDSDGKKYIDYHAAFGPYVLGHNDAAVNAAVVNVLSEQHSLYGSGTTSLEGDLAELICGCAPFLESVALLNTGSEATYQALRLARAATGRDHIIVMQGGYNGWHNDVACNLMTPLKDLGERRTGDEYPFLGISAGIPQSHKDLVHPVEYNDLDAVRAVASKYPTAAIILEPILQNIGVVKPNLGYLQELRKLADELGFLLIFDEVKTGFRHALGGYAALSGVNPDLAVYGKAIANGYPVAAIGGRKDILELFNTADATKRVLLAGTYNAHPVMVAAAIATIQHLKSNDGEVYRRFEEQGAWLQNALENVGKRLGVEMVVARQGSALCPYFMDHLPVDWYDLASHHDFDLDQRVRKQMIADGVYVFPIAVKQWSISAAHTQHDLEHAVEAFEAGLAKSIVDRNAK